MRVASWNDSIRAREERLLHWLEAHEPDRRFDPKEPLVLCGDFNVAPEPLAASCTAASIDRDERKGKQPSDHAPVLAEFEL